MEDLSFKHCTGEYEKIAGSCVQTARADIISTVLLTNQKASRGSLAFEVAGRPKTHLQHYNKMLKRNKPIEKSTISLRRMLSIQRINSDCFTHIIVQNVQTIPERFKDYISVPKKNDTVYSHTVMVRMAEW